MQGSAVVAKSVAKVIAIVDDDRNLRDALKNLLETAGYESHLYASAEAFLEDGGYEAVDCILTDVRMPGMSGVTMLGELQGIPHLPPIVIMTSHDDCKTIAAAANSMASAFLSKPVDTSELLRCLAALT
jgi:FixJ family two-component response regulator